VIRERRCLLAVYFSFFHFLKYGSRRHRAHLFLDQAHAPPSPITSSFVSFYVLFPRHPSLRFHLPEATRLQAVR